MVTDLDQLESPTKRGFAPLRCTTNLNGMADANLELKQNRYGPSQTKILLCILALAG